MAERLKATVLKTVGPQGLVGSNPTPSAKLLFFQEFAMKLIRQPGSSVRVGEWLLSNLGDPKWSEFRAAVAFAKTSGVAHLAGPLASFSARGHARLSVGIDAFGTSFEALQSLLECVGTGGQLWVFHNEANHLFHPKVYMFRNQVEASAVIGSNNLTGGGLFTNYEVAIEVPLDLSVGEDRSLLQELEELLDSYCSEDSGTALRLNPQSLTALLEDRYILKEAEIGPRTAPQPVGRKSRFKSPPVPPPPLLPRKATGRKTVPACLPAPSLEIRGFVMTLQQTDAGHGQITPGTSRRSPEIFLPVAAVRDVAPEFWGWDHLFVPHAEDPGMKGRSISVRIGGDVVDATIWRNYKKNDFRLRSEAVRSAGHVDDILRVEIGLAGAPYDYYIEIVPQGSRMYSQFLALCVNSVRNSHKRWGYYT